MEAQYIQHMDGKQLLEQDDMEHGMYIQLGTIELWAEARRGRPFVYFERSTHDNAQGGTFDEVTLGLPGLHVELTRRITRHEPHATSAAEELHETDGGYR